MKTSEFDSSDEEDFGEVEATPFQISWLSLSVVECSQSLGICSLPVAACLLLLLSVSMTPSAALEILRELRGGGAIQTVKQYNFLHEFREKFEAYQETKERLSERSVSR
uniref:protein-tyrosine-phosphatase n=1 Tax=Sinocyclocheilus anshuiensis TaxID=1608454 RepID=A0A671NQH3_9TELE